MRLVDAEWKGIGISGGLHTRQSLDGLQCLPLKGAPATFRIACQTQFKGHGRHVLRRKTELHLQSLLQATQRKQRSGYQYKAERTLNDDQNVAEAQAPAPPHREMSTEHQSLSRCASEA